MLIENSNNKKSSLLFVKSVNFELTYSLQKQFYTPSFRFQ